MKTVIALLCFMVLLTGMAYAEGFQLAPMDTAAPVVAVPPLNLQGDTALIFRKGEKDEIMPGVGMDLVEIKGGIGLIRAETFFPPSNPGQVIVGIAGSVNLPKLAQLYGSTWLATTINPSLGVVVGYDLARSKPAVGVMLTVIKLEF